MHENPNVLFICQYLTESIVQERGLPTLNVAGTNRAARLALALQAAEAQVWLLSSATFMRQKWTGTFCHPRRVARAGRLPVLFTLSVGLPFISTLLEPLAMLQGMRSICRKHPPDVVVVYNYYLAPLLIALITKWFYGAKMILDIEDVCVPRLADWFGRWDKGPLQQLVGSWLLKLGVAGCDRVLVPSRRFLSAVKIEKGHIVVTGCIGVQEGPTKPEKLPSEPLRVLVSGTLDQEQGVGLVLGAVKTLTRRPPTRRPLEFHFSGFAEDEPALQKSVRALEQEGARITYHGLLSTEAYLGLLHRVDVCVAMQKPHGRHGGFKTPSKVYEYLAYGKVVIASDVGDFKELPEEVISLCDYQEDTLASRLVTFADNWGQWKRMGQRAAVFAHQEFSLRAVGERILRSISSVVH